MKTPWLAAFAALWFPCASEAAEFQLVDQRQLIHAPAVAEASGIAISRRSENLLWIVNDSGDTPDLHLIGTDGTDRGKATVADSHHVDWEDLASFTLDGNPYLLIADTGDNASRRESCTLLIVREPPAPVAGQLLAVTLKPAWKIDFRYEGGPRDCEAVAVDAARERVILVTKRTVPPEVHELPLRAPAKRGMLVARKIGDTAVDSASILPFHDQPTGLDISQDGLSAVVVTYHGVFLFPRKPDETWSEVFSRKALQLGPHRLPQAEAVASSTDGKTIFVTSEGKNPLIRCFRR